MARTLAQVQASLELWYAAHDAVSQGQSFNMNGRSLSFVDADMIWRQITALERVEQKLQKAAAGSNMRVSLSNFNHDTE